jgi:hypothetical protein
MAWVLLASRNASLTLACLQTLFDNNQAPFAVKAVARKTGRGVYAICQ